MSQKTSWTELTEKPREESSSGSPSQNEVMAWGEQSGSPRRCEATSWGNNSGSLGNSEAIPKGEKEWWQSFFDNEWKKFSFDAHPPELTRKQVDFIIEALELNPDSNIFDLCCGIGRHALELSRRGFKHVTGQDFTQPYLDIAAARASKEGLSAEFLNSDMRRIPGYANLDAIYCWHTSFGYFENEAENEKVADAVGGALKQGGRFLLDTVSRDWLVRSFKAQTWHGESPNYILERNRFDLATSTHHGEWTFISEDGKARTRRMQLRQYSLHELIEIFARYGLRFIQAWGSIEGEPFAIDSRRMIVLFVKGEVSKTSIARELR
jgi:SAM-dependent methyltransferase